MSWEFIMPSAYKCNSLSLESTQDREFLDILEELQKHEPCISDIGTTGTTDKRLQGHFCSGTVFNLSNRVLSENEIKVLEKGLDFAPIQRKINKPELRNLVRVKLYPLKRKVGSEKCGKSRCEVCVNIQETDTFTSTTTGESFKINHKLNCDDNCLIYLLTCKCCGKQYVGETTDEFRLRWNNYKSTDRKNTRNEACTQEQHFKSEGHSGFLGNVSIPLIDKTDGRDL